MQYMCANLCGAYARPTNERSLVREGEGYNQGSFVYSSKACGGWAGLSSIAVAGVWAPTTTLKRDWFVWKTTRWENCPTQLVACLGDLKGRVNDYGH